MKNISKEVVYSRFLDFCKEHPIGLPQSIVSEFDNNIINELIDEGKIINYPNGIGGVFYTLTDESGNPIYKHTW